MSDVVYTGELKRGEQPGTVVGILTDAWGWSLHIVGTIKAEGGGYTLSATVGDPGRLALPLIDAPNK